MRSSPLPGDRENSASGRLSDPILERRGGHFGHTAGAIMKVLLGFVSLVLVFAATPSEVSPVVARDGYFIEAGSDATDAVVGNAVSEARFAGGALSVVVLSRSEEHTSELQSH